LAQKAPGAHESHELAWSFLLGRVQAEAEPPPHFFDGRQRSARLTARSMSPIRWLSAWFLARFTSFSTCSAASWAAFLLV
jgi:hypothetical protein